MLSLRKLVTRLLLSRGVRVVLSPESQELAVVVPTVPARVLSVTCVEVVVCSLQRRPGEDGTSR